MLEEDLAGCSGSAEIYLLTFSTIVAWVAHILKIYQDCPKSLEQVKKLSVNRSYTNKQFYWWGNQQLPESWSCWHFLAVCSRPISVFSGLQWPLVPNWSHNTTLAFDKVLEKILESPWISYREFKIFRLQDVIIYHYIQQQYWNNLLC